MNPEGLWDWMDALRKQDIESLAIESDVGLIKVTVSIGVAKYQQELLNNTVKNSDKALYQAKADGKNKIEFFIAED
jgi:diguanylate cyclase (GGDEF)-like protein